MLSVLKLKRLYLLTVIFIAGFVIYQAANIRWVGYEHIPNIGIFDERNYALQGLGLRRYGIPFGWSDSGAYEHTEGKLIGVKITGFTIKINDQIPSLINFRSLPKPVIAVEQFDFGLGMQHLKLVLPFIDHPPVGGFIISLGVPDSVKSFLDLKPEHFRQMSLTLAIITSILLFTFTILLSGEIWVALIAVILYSTIPTYLLASRYALLENVLAPMALLHLNLLLISQKLFHKNYRLSLLFLVSSGIIGGLAILTKESGIGFILGSLLLLFLWRFPRKFIILFILNIGLVLSMYVSYTLWLSPKLFLEILNFNATRGFFGSLNLLSMLPSLRFQNFPFDGWWIWGFISLFLLSLKEGRKYLSLLIPMLGHLSVIILMSNANYPWYYLALIPFLSISSAWSLWYIFKSPSLPILVSFFLIPLSSSFYWGYSVFHLPPQILSYRILFFVFFFIAAFKLIKSDSKKITLLWSIFCILLFLLIIQWNIRSIYFIIAHWQNLPFPSLPAF